MAAAAISDDRRAVLSEAIEERIDGRRVRAAFFTTFTFDPGFFELHVLPTLFGGSLHHTEKIRRVQLDDKLRASGPVAVYYDAEGISPDATPAHLDFARIGLNRKTGCFHPKLVFVLVDDKVEDELEEARQGDPPQALIVGALSANLTRAGWWENVEAAHFEELCDREVSDEKCSFRGDLLSLLKQLRWLAKPDDDHRALDLVRGFVRDRVTRDEPAYRMHAGRYHTRLFFGQMPLAEWLIDAGLRRFEWNMEVISPYFDARDTGVLHDLIDAIEPRETRVFLPLDHSGDALVTPAFYESVAEIAAWSDLPADIQQRGGGKLREDAATRRRVHAKVYRFWHADGREVILTGSVNLTSPAHSSSKGGNFEAAFLADAGDTPGKRRWWLQPLDHEPECAEQVEKEDDAATRVLVDLDLRYDWNRHAFEYRLNEPADGPLEIKARAGTPLCIIESPVEGEWTPLPERAADGVRELLASTSFVQVHHPTGSWRVLIREEGMLQKPTLLRDLSPEEILRYWSLLSDDQRAEFIEQRLEDAGTLEGLEVSRGRLHLAETVFDRVAGVFHAFEAQYRRLASAIDRDEMQSARATLFGSKYDSLPVLLQKTADAKDADPVMAYLTFLSARQLLTRLEANHRDFAASCREDRHHLEEALSRLDELRAALLRDQPDREAFLAWYEEMFGGVLDVEEAPA